MNELFNYEEIVLSYIDEYIDLIYPLIGLGARMKDLIDLIATKCYKDMISKINDDLATVSVISVEGKRDGIDVSNIDKYNDNYNKSNIFIAIDPVDGTLTTSRGGSRGISVIAISKEINKKYYHCLNDDLCCLALGSNIDESFTNQFISDGERILINNFNKAFQNGDISSINRIDNIELFKNILDCKGENLFDVYDIQIGERTSYQPNMLINNNIFVGDTTIPLSSECNYFFGRVGIAEARIESFLWKYWNGILISSKKMKTYSSGRLAYYIDRIKAIKDTSVDLSNFFDKEELISLYQNGWTDEEIRGELDNKKFIFSFENTIIISLTGTKDSLLPKHFNNSLKAMKLTPKRDCLIYEYWLYKGKELTKKVHYCKIKHLKKWYANCSWEAYLINNSTMEFNQLNLIQYLEKLETGKEVDYKKWEKEDVEVLMTLT